MAEGTFTRAASDHDLVYGYAFAGVLLGHGTEPWVAGPQKWHVLPRARQHKGLPFIRL